MGLLDLTREAKNLLSIQEFMVKQGSLKTDWQYVIYTDLRGIPSIEVGKFGVGAVNHMVCVVHNQKVAYIFLDGEFLYSVKMSDVFNRDLLERKVEMKISSDKYIDMNKIYNESNWNKWGL